MSARRVKQSARVSTSRPLTLRQVYWHQRLSHPVGRAGVSTVKRGATAGYHTPMRRVCMLREWKACDVGLDEFEQHEYEVHSILIDLLKNVASLICVTCRIGDAALPVPSGGFPSWRRVYGMPSQNPHCLLPS